MKKYFLILIMLSLAACTTTGTQNHTVSPTALNQFNEMVTQENLLSGQVILGAPLLAEDLPEDNILALTEEMEFFLDKYVLSRVEKPYRAQQLNRVLFDEEILGMKYDVTKTFTARGAFDNKLGNCLAFSYLYSSFAAKADILFEYQEVDIPLEWSPKDGNISKTWRHINLRVKNGASAGSVFDIDEIKTDQILKSRTITLPHAMALYYSNIGVENLLNGYEKEAFLYFVKGLSLEPKEPDLWVNLGVLYKRGGYYNYAKLAYENALSLDNENYTANVNMANLYLVMGNNKKAKYFHEKAENSQIINPNYQYRMAQIAFNNKDYRNANIHLDFALDYGITQARYIRLKEKIEVKQSKLYENRKMPFRTINLKLGTAGLVLY